jgi:carbamoyl-phosphate synthase small subunit
MKAYLVLEDGTFFEGKSFGAAGEMTGEVVFNTSMTGYQEILTDPSYKGQIVAMTYPLIGNYGINPEDMEAKKPALSGFVVRESSRSFSNWRATGSLANYLKKYNIIGIEGVDTRAVTLHIRQAGAMKGVLSTEDLDPVSLTRKAQAAPGLTGRDLVKEVTCPKAYGWNSKGRYKVVLIDCGAKFNIMRELTKRDCQIDVVPADTSLSKILDFDPHGVMLSNGPGDPAAVTSVINTVQQLIGRLPIFGICLGHQILALALGGKTYKLKFGHRGANHPVMDLKTRKVEITCQNHGFCVDLASLDQKEVELTHVNLNDGTLEGLRHKRYPVFSVQYHPEASAGPHDSKYLFDRFIEEIRNAQTH